MQRIVSGSADRQLSFEVNRGGAGSKENRLGPALGWAIMRRESAFAPEVTSIADARGLMQLIPPTASNVTSHLKLAPVDAAELYAPDWNIRLGTWYLRHVLDNLSSHPVLATAAYNAGPGRARGWQAAMPRTSLPSMPCLLPLAG